MPDHDFNTAAARPEPRELVAAVNKFDLEAVQDMLRHGADIAEADRLMRRDGKWNSGGCTMLGWAALCGEKEIVVLLAEAGADIDGRDQGGYTPLMRAVTNYQSEIAYFLISKGAATDKKSNDGHTIWDFAGPFENMTRILHESIEDHRRAVEEAAAAKTNALHTTAADRQKDLIARARASKVVIKRIPSNRRT